MPSHELFCGNTSCGVRFGILGSNPRKETSAGPEGFARNKKSGFEMDVNLARGLEQEIIKRIHLTFALALEKEVHSLLEKADM